MEVINPPPSHPLPTERYLNPFPSLPAREGDEIFGDMLEITIWHLLASIGYMGESKWAEKIPPTFSIRDFFGFSTRNIQAITTFYYR